jgi:hypothetical protein
MAILAVANDLARSVNHGYVDVELVQSAGFGSGPAGVSGKALLCFESSLADQRLDATIGLLELVRGDVLSDHSDNGHCGKHRMLQQLAHCQYLAGRPIVRDINFDYHNRFLSTVLGMRPPKLDIPYTSKGLASQTSPSSAALRRASPAWHWRAAGTPVPG